MTREQLKKSIRCEIDFSVFIHDLFPIKEMESSDFYDSIYAAIYKLREQLIPEQFKEFEKLLGGEINNIYPENETFSIPPEGDMETGRNDRYSFVKLFHETEHPPITYIQELFTNLMSSLIKENLINAVVELYFFAGSMPVAGQVYGLYAYERTTQKTFKEYRELHNIIPGCFYYLKEIYYNERSTCDADWPLEYGVFDLRFCRYNTGDIY